MAAIRVRMDDTDCMVSVKCEISFVCGGLSAKRDLSSPEVGGHPARVESAGGQDCQSYNNPSIYENGAVMSVLGQQSVFMSGHCCSHAFIVQ